MHFFDRMIELFSDLFTLLPVGVLGDGNGPSYFEGNSRKGAGDESLVPVFKAPRTFRFYGKENDGTSGSFGENDDTWLGNSRGASRPIHNNAWGFSFAGAFNKFLKSLLSSGGGRSSNDLASKVDGNPASQISIPASTDEGHISIFTDKASEWDEISVDCRAYVGSKALSYVGTDRSYSASSDVSPHQFWYDGSREVVQDSCPKG